MTTRADQSGLDLAEFAIDRDAEVPIGVQLAWALRTRIYDGRFTPGQRLPGLRELAEATAVNVNTIKAVYQRLDKEGLIDSQQGSGTFVASVTQRPRDLGAIVANAVREARETGVDPREVAAALYVAHQPAQITDTDAERRRQLRAQIASLERALGEIEAAHPGVAPRGRKTRPSRGPRLLTAEELEQVRTQLVRQLATVQAAIDEQEQTDGKRPKVRQRRSAQSTSNTKQKPNPVHPRTATRPAPASR
jgi:GntR family transcriptional regulator